MSNRVISRKNKKITGEVHLDGSKSLSNRALIIRALSGHEFKIHRLSDSDDSQTMLALLNQDREVYDAHHAGTTYRFLTAYLALKAGTQTLTGSSRMQERPIGVLVKALRSIGANIEYMVNEGYPPLKIHDFDYSAYQRDIRIGGGTSSQYLSALLLIAPTLPDGLRLEIEGELVSRPYLQMTLNMMESMGIAYDWMDNIIDIKAQIYHNNDIVIEADWSAASYYYSILALSDTGSTIKLHGLFADSWQGDQAITEIGKQFGVLTTYVEDYILIEKKESILSSKYEHDFIEHPDLAQTVAVMSAGTGVQSLFSGLQTLKIKETDRIHALSQELGKLGVTLSKLPPKFSKKSNETYYLIDGKAISGEDPPSIATYKDHRMAMAFAPLALLFPIEIQESEVVSKSYPRFWEDMEGLGFEVI